jgi:hypothetical protein
MTVISIASSVIAVPILSVRIFALEAAVLSTAMSAIIMLWVVTTCCPEAQGQTNYAKNTFHNRFTLLVRSNAEAVLTSGVKP